MTTTHDMRALRLQLVDCERTLRTDREYFEEIKATIVKRAIDAGEITGKNAEERERNTIVYLSTDEQYRAKAAELRHAEWQRDRTAALLEAAKDERRAVEWQIRAKLADGLFRQGVQSDADDPNGDAAFDDVQYHGITAEAASRREGRTDTEDDWF